MAQPPTRDRDTVQADASQTTYAESLGERLRNVRTQQNLSLHDVERMSEGEYKASVLGAYERGERSVSVARLHGLADFYRVPLTELMPASSGRVPVESAAPLGGIRLDLTTLERSGIDGTETITRFVGSIQGRRGDYNGRVITIRRDDMRALAAVLDISPRDLRQRLAAAGIASEGEAGQGDG